MDVDIAELVRIAGSHWAIEERFQAAKNECGLGGWELARYQPHKGEVELRSWSTRAGWGRGMVPISEWCLRVM
ncbi:hypothetical protein ABZZ21_25590 [Streptomyces ossamyceticus]|uniref:DDE family transposase n=1 Tax=Streptomyces ossamyceticus TaxID=249581 RepID=A0ABV2V212_9ACTN